MLRKTLISSGATKVVWKKQKLDAAGAFQQQTSSVIEASYEVALEIAKQMKPHTIGETLIKPCTLKMVKRVLGDASERKIQQISLSNDTVKRRVNEMSDDIKEKVIQEIKSSLTGMFAIQLDELTDVSSCAQLLYCAPDMEVIREELAPSPEDNESER